VVPSELQGQVHVAQGVFFVVRSPRIGAHRDHAGRLRAHPGGSVQRVGNAGAEPAVGIAVRVVQGPVTVNLDGPELQAGLPT
jgi:hypothetical protein